MGRLIDADEYCQNQCAYKGQCSGTQRSACSITAMPTVDAVPVVHGKWCWEGRFKACSCCGSYVEWDETLGADFWKFCPHCGARMDLERSKDV